jgi:hypothetical protein
LNWEFIEFIFLTSFVGQGVLNKDPSVWLGGARPPPLVLFYWSCPDLKMSFVRS